MTGQLEFWDFENWLRELSAQGDPLEKLAATVDFEIFRVELDAASARRDPSKGGRPGSDPVLKVLMLVLQSMHELSLEQTEYLLRDRLSWMRFCGLGPGDPVPDANTLPGQDVDRRTERRLETGPAVAGTKRRPLRPPRNANRPTH